MYPNNETNNENDQKSFHQNTTSSPKSSQEYIDKDEICAICRENECDFETRCRHYFHQECLEAACMLRDGEPACPYCTKGISLNREIEILLQDPLKIREKALTLNLGKECVEGIFKYAVKNVDIPVLEVAVYLGADIHADNEYVLRCSARYGLLDIVKYLKEQGANIHADDEYALLNSAENGHLDVVKYLVELGADIHADKKHALRVSAENGRMDIVKYLVEQGADIHANDEYALRKSAENGHLKVAEYLKGEGADI